MIPDKVSQSSSHHSLSSVQEPIVVQVDRRSDSRISNVGFQGLNEILKNNHSPIVTKHSFSFPIENNSGIAKNVNIIGRNEFFLKGGHNSFDTTSIREIMNTYITKTQIKVDNPLVSGVRGVFEYLETQRMGFKDMDQLLNTLTALPRDSVEEEDEVRLGRNMMTNLRNAGNFVNAEGEELNDEEFEQLMQGFDAFFITFQAKIASKKTEGSTKAEDLKDNSEKLPAKRKREEEKIDQRSPEPKRPIESETVDKESALRNKEIASKIDGKKKYEERKAETNLHSLIIAKDIEKKRASDEEIDKSVEETGV